jgi:predicted Zn-dependent protease
MEITMPWIARLCAALALVACGTARGFEPCGSLENAVGPYDYRTASAKKKEIVERFHFTESVEALSKGQSSVAVGADIAYTLRAFPNHPRALIAMADLALRQKTDRPHGSPYTVACWFERAIRFRPDDGKVRLSYGVALLKRGEREPAIRQLLIADRLVPNDPNVNYNLGLAYFYGKDYVKARERAKEAYALGFPLPGLRDMLVREHQWE